MPFSLGDLTNRPAGVLPAEWADRELTTDPATVPGADPAVPDTVAA